jgi:hypothetical protein
MHEQRVTAKHTCLTVVVVMILRLYDTAGPLNVSCFWLHITLHSCTTYKGIPKHFNIFCFHTGFHSVQAQASLSIKTLHLQRSDFMKDSNLYFSQTTNKFLRLRKINGSLSQKKKKKSTTKAFYFTWFIWSLIQELSLCYCFYFL